MTARGLVLMLFALGLVHFHSSTSSLLCSAYSMTCSKSATGTGGIGISTACGTNLFRGGDALTQPTVIQSVNGWLNATLTIESFVMNATMFSFKTRAFCYNGVCSVPGPTLRFYPGDKLNITVINKLSSFGQTTSTMHNMLHNPNTTNLHTHGLHVDPTVDNIFIEIGPGSSHSYLLNIPSDHLPGLHWYHSHYHGASVLHVMGGMVGAIDVLWNPSNTPPSSLSAMRSNLLVLSHHSMCSCNPTTDPFRIISYTDLATEAGDLMYSVQVGSNNISDVYLVNGQYQPYFNLTTNEWVRFDVVNAVGDTYGELEVRTAIQGGSLFCDVMALAYDGVYLTSPRVVTFVALAPATRANIAVRCSQSGTYYMQLTPGYRICDAEAQFAQNLVTLYVSGSAVSMTTPTWTSASIPYPYYLTSLLTATVSGTFQLDSCC
eukprot:c9756_g1_i2.p1 GENE.c9756_g1_i2~~c9756_g1_i2.p1  ORF type:complete len:451 (-),score=137.44 c9756_g1_i2:431-1729(-)